MAALSLPGKRTTWAWSLATFFGIGFLTPGEGTWASAVTTLLWWLIARGITYYPRAAVCAMTAAAVTLAGIPAAATVARESGEKDPGFVVIDEVAGQLVALVFTPLRWQYLLASFILFRAFDILKPPPIGSLESLAQGYGIMLDDLAAGVYVLALILIGARFQVFGS